MTEMVDLLDRYREWNTTKNEQASGPLKLLNRIDQAPSSQNEIRNAWGERALPADLREFWSVSREAWLFEDVEYGQWGLHVLSPADSASRTAADREARPDDYRDDDIVVGEFLGDQELLVSCPSELSQRRMLVSMPLDGRHEWISAGHSLFNVLHDFLNCEGEKYWERERGR